MALPAGKLESGHSPSISSTSSTPATSSSALVGGIRVAEGGLLEFPADALILFSYHDPHAIKVERGLGTMAFPSEMQILEKDHILSAEDLRVAQRMTPGDVTLFRSGGGNFRGVIIACVGERDWKRRKQRWEDLFSAMARQSSTLAELLELAEPILSSVLQRAEEAGYKSLVLSGIPLSISEKLGEELAAQPELVQLPRQLFRLSKDGQYCYSKTASWERPGFRTGINRWPSNCATRFGVFRRALQASIDRSKFSGEVTMVLPAKATAVDYQRELTRRKRAANWTGTIVLVMTFSAFPIAVILEQIRQGLGVETLNPWVGVFWALYGSTLALGVPAALTLFLSLAGMDQFADLKEDSQDDPEKQPKRGGERAGTKAAEELTVTRERGEISGMGGKIGGALAVVATLGVITYGLVDALGGHGFTPPRGWEIVAIGVVFFFVAIILGGAGRRERWKRWREKFQAGGRGRGGGAGHSQSRDL
jgi:hypothetical protein